MARRSGSGHRIPASRVAALVLTTAGAACISSAANPEIVTVAEPTQAQPCWYELAGLSLPVPRANHVLARLDTPDGQTWWIAGLGIGADRDAKAVSSALWVGEGALPQWRPLAPPLGDWQPRLASQAVAVDGQFVVFGGYTVAADGSEESLARVDTYNPVEAHWTAGAPMPIPVDDAVALVWRDRYVLLVSGWSQRDNVQAVQLYDARQDNWAQLTDFPAPGRFGHFGALHEDALIVCDGVTRHDDAPRYRAFKSCVQGELGLSEQGVSLRWTPAAPHPGPPRYRAAALSLAGQALVVGGSDNPYNYSGIGYDEVESKPLPEALLWDWDNESWRIVDGPTTPVMDLRALVAHADGAAVLGGMRQGPEVTALGQAFSPSGCPAN